MANKTAPAVKVVLGKRPKNFPKEIKFEMLDSSTGCMEVIYKYRTLTEFADFADDIQAKLRVEADAEQARVKELIEKGEPVPEFTQAELIKHRAAYNISYIMESVEGWNLDVPFNKEAVAELVDTLPAAVTAIVSNYRDAITEGRLGN